MGLLKKINIKNFYGFDSISVEETSPVNLIIGKNDSGKTGLLKLIYATARTLVEMERNKAPELQKPSFRTALASKLNTTFTPRKRGLGDLVSKGAKDSLEGEMVFSETDELNINFSFSGEATKEILHSNTHINNFTKGFNCIYIPAKEVLSVLRSIRFLKPYNYYEFDDTYFDLVDALYTPTQKGRVADTLTNISNELEHLFEGEIQQNLGDELNPYIFKKGKSKFMMPQTAEGVKKIGILTTLFRNRELNRNTILIMDEPETTLHPKAQRQLANMLFEMSKENIQIFLATHSYFMISEFTNIARRENTSITCLSIESDSRNKNRTVEESNLKDGMPENAIIEEAIRMFNDDTEIELGL